jgi:hypothetical protein
MMMTRMNSGLLISRIQKIAMMRSWNLILTMSMSSQMNYCLKMILMMSKRIQMRNYSKNFEMRNFPKTSLRMSFARKSFHSNCFQKSYYYLMIEMMSKKTLTKNYLMS